MAEATETSGCVCVRINIAQKAKANNSLVMHVAIGNPLIKGE
jgi:hypothetical protein